MSTNQKGTTISPHSKKYIITRRQPKGAFDHATLFMTPDGNDDVMIVNEEMTDWTNSYDLAPHLFDTRDEARQNKYCQQRLNPPEVIWSVSVDSENNQIVAFIKKHS